MRGAGWRGAAAAAILTGAVILPAAAGEPGRYTMLPTADGALRLDTETGAVSHCARKGGGWVCESVADDRLALQREIDRLARENDNLRDELAALQANLSPVPEGGTAAPAPEPQQPEAGAEAPEAKPAPKAEGDGVRLPNQEDMDKLVSFFERMARRLHDMMEQLKERQSQPQQERL